MAESHHWRVRLRSPPAAALAPFLCNPAAGKSIKDEAFNQCKKSDLKKLQRSLIETIQDLARNFRYLLCYP
jgi:hypothetical protein